MNGKFKALSWKYTNKYGKILFYVFRLYFFVRLNKMCSTVLFSLFFPFSFYFSAEFLSFAYFSCIAVCRLYDIAHLQNFYVSLCIQNSSI